MHRSGSMANLRLAISLMKLGKTPKNQVHSNLYRIHVVISKND